MLTKFDRSCFRRFGDMIGANQNLSGLRDLTTPLLGMMCHPWASTCCDQPISTHYEDIKGDTKCRNWGGLG